MNDRTPSSDIPAPDIKPVRKSLMQRASIVWLVPLGALLISLGVVWQTYNDRGPVIEIAFTNASGIHSGETELRYRDITVGIVEDVSFSDDLSSVLATVRLDKDVAPYVDLESQFWVVRPQVTTRGVSGLDTVLSGVFIEGSWDTTIEQPKYSFTGLESPPLRGADSEGLIIKLRTGNGTGLAEDTPILFKGIEVGRIANVRLDDDGFSVIADGFINAPHDKLISSATRFWDTSGFTFSIGAGGAELDVKSLASLLAGGVSFDTLVSGGGEVKDGDIFELFVDESRARSSVFSDPADGQVVRLAIVFEGNAAGLAAGAPVEFAGVNVGEVIGLTGFIDEEQFGDKMVRLMTTVEFRPGKLGLGADATLEEIYGYLDDAVALGVRARLETASLLTGGLKITFSEIENPRPAVLQRRDDQYPVFPSIESDLTDVAATAEGVFTRINELPIEELLSSAINLLDSTNLLINNDSIQKTPDEVLALLGDVRGVVGAEAVQALPEQAGALMASLKSSVEELAGIMKTIEDEKAVSALVDAVEAAGKAADNIRIASEGAPALLESLNTLAKTANDLPFDALVKQATALMDTADGFIGTPDAKELPAALNGALGEVAAVLSDLRTGGVVENANQAMGSARKAADAVASATGDLPQIVRRMNALIAQAESTLAGFDEKSTLSNDTRGMLREIRDAAKAVTSLARTIERRPNSILIGR